MIVDSHISPESARVMLRELKAISDKPVRFLVNTHFHYDHTNGNQVFGPAVDMIGHEFTRAKMSGANYMAGGLFGDLLTGLPKQLDRPQSARGRRTGSGGEKPSSSSSSGSRPHSPIR